MIHAFGIGGGDRSAAWWDQQRRKIDDLSCSDPELQYLIENNKEACAYEQWHKVTDHQGQPLPPEILAAIKEHIKHCLYCYTLLSGYVRADIAES